MRDGIHETDGIFETLFHILTSVCTKGQICFWVYWKNAGLYLLWHEKMGRVRPKKAETKDSVLIKIGSSELREIEHLR